MAVYTSRKTRELHQEETYCINRSTLIIISLTIVMLIFILSSFLFLDSNYLGKTLSELVTSIISILIGALSAWLICKIYYEERSERIELQRSQQISILEGLETSIKIIEDNLKGHRKDIELWSKNAGKFPSYSITSLDSSFLITRIADKIDGKPTKELKSAINLCKEKIEDVNNQSNREILSMIIQNATVTMSKTQSQKYAPITDIARLHYHDDLKDRISILRIELAKILN